MRLTKLPRGGHWEVGVLRPPPEAGDLPPLVLVVDARDALIRFAMPLSAPGDLTEAVRNAATKPPRGGPARPKTLRCLEPEREALKEVAKALGASLQVATALPAVDQAAAELRQELTGAPPLLPAVPEPWPALLEDLTREAPWVRMPDGVQFRFLTPVEALQDAIAIVIGQAGEQRGLSVFPSQRDHDLFLARALGGEVADGAWSCWCVHLDRVDELPPAHVEAARALGLVRGELALQLFAMEGGEARLLEPFEERICQAAVQGVLGAWRPHRGALEYGPTLTPVRTALGDLKVASAPRLRSTREEPLLLEVEHAVIVADLEQRGVRRRGLVMKAARRDAERLSKLLTRVDALSLEPRADGRLDVGAWQGELRLGVLCRVADAPQIRALRGDGLLAVSAGGARRTTLRDEDLVDVIRVTFLEPGIDESAPRDGGPFLPHWRDTASWEGPPESWPKASTVLLDFAAPLGIDRMTADDLERAVQTAALVWTSVVMADAAGDRSLLDRLRGQTRARREVLQVVDELVARKRALYPQDTRLMMVDAVTRTRGMADVRVSWRMP